MVVMLNVPLCVVGEPSYMNCMLRERFCVREALRSIFRSRTGSSVAFSWKSSLAVLVDGVATDSFMMSHPLSLALSR